MATPEETAVLAGETRQLGPIRRSARVGPSRFSHSD
jgi:hypothetical protein